MTFLVQRRACSSCIFRKENAEMLPRLLAQIADPFMKGYFKGHRVCHHSKEACCRGFWNRFKNHFTAGQLAQRLGWVEFVHHDVLGNGCSGVPGGRESPTQQITQKGKRK